MGDMTRWSGFARGARQPYEAAIVRENPNATHVVQWRNGEKSICLEMAKSPKRNMDKILTNDELFGRSR